MEEFPEGSKVDPDWEEEEQEILAEFYETVRKPAIATWKAKQEKRAAAAKAAAATAAKPKKGAPKVARKPKGPTVKSKPKAQKAKASGAAGKNAFNTTAVGAEDDGGGDDAPVKATVYAETKVGSDTFTAINAKDDSFAHTKAGAQAARARIFQMFSKSATVEATSQKTSPKKSFKWEVKTKPDTGKPADIKNVLITDEFRPKAGDSKPKENPADAATNHVQINAVDGNNAEAGVMPEDVVDEKPLAAETEKPKEDFKPTSFSFSTGADAGDDKQVEEDVVKAAASEPAPAPEPEPEPEEPKVLTEEEQLQAQIAALSAQMEDSDDDADVDADAADAADPATAATTPEPEPEPEPEVVAEITDEETEEEKIQAQIAALSAQMDDDEEDTAPFANAAADPADNPFAIAADPAASAVQDNPVSVN